MAREDDDISEEMLRVLLAEGIEIGLLLVFLDPRQVRHVGLQRDVWVVGEDLGSGHDESYGEQPWANRMASVE